MKESRQHDVEWKNRDTNEYIIHDSIYIKLKKKNKNLLILEAKIMVISREEKEGIDKEQGTGKLSEYWWWSIFYMGGDHMVISTFLAFTKV